MVVYKMVGFEGFEGVGEHGFDRSRRALRNGIFALVLGAAIAVAGVAANASVAHAAGLTPSACMAVDARPAACSGVQPTAPDLRQAPSVETIGRPAITNDAGASMLVDSACRHIYTSPGLATASDAGTSTLDKPFAIGNGRANALPEVSPFKRGGCDGKTDIEVIVAVKAWAW